MQWWRIRLPGQETKRHRFSPWVRKIPGVGNGNPPQYSYLENSMDRGAWRATVHEVAESDTTKHTHSPAKYCVKFFLYYLYNPHQNFFKRRRGTKTQNQHLCTHIGSEWWSQDVKLGIWLQRALFLTFGLYCIADIVNNKPILQLLR